MDAGISDMLERGLGGHVETGELRRGSMEASDGEMVHGASG